MAFQYHDINTVSFNGMRLYVVGENYYPSITTVLGNTSPAEKIESLNNWRNSIGHEEADKITKEAAESGTTVHAIIEKFLKKEPIDRLQYDEKAMKGFLALKIPLSKVSEVWGQEVALFSEKLGIAGRCDCIGVYENKPCIIDFKTARRLKHEEDINDYFLQLTAYSIMHNEMFGTKIVDGVILMSSGFGFPQIFKKNLVQYYDKLKTRVHQFYKTFDGDA